MIYNEQTEKLINEIREAKNLHKYIKKYDQEFPNLSFQDYINILIQKKNLTKADVIKTSGFHRTYAYQVLSGKKKPSRDKATILAFGLVLNLDETQHLLKMAEYNPLTPKSKRDAIIIFSIINNFSIQDTNFLLYENNEDLLS